MAVIVAVMRESGTGKPTSLRNFKQGENVGNQCIEKAASFPQHVISFKNG